MSTIAHDHFDTGIIGTVFMVLGIILNLIMLIGMHYINLSSRLTMWLFRSQVVFDGFSCLLTILTLWVRDIQLHDSVSGAIVCYLWNSQAAYWTVTALSTCNLMCITLDRLLATVYCATYRFYQTRYIVGCTIATFTYGTSVVVPTILLVYYENGTCETEVRPEFRVAFITASLDRPYWAVMYYMLPLIFLMAVNFRVVWHIRNYFRLRGSFTGPKQIVSTATATEISGGSEDRRGAAQSRSVVKSLTIGTLALIATMILAHSYDSFKYIFGPLLGHPYIFGSNEQLIGLLITSINCLANPVILTLSLPTMRTFIFDRSHKAIRKIKTWLLIHCSHRKK
ncbi:hypothetical protein EG68_07681 [Paragonimus skrjabini miyazakii]|uniref:G-protein coupled receptors family 1 profile domain-containing protein n=1 Tax=Paragonimus skrjabini miyazakii TaxID=59628 RepID=A0A8S9YL67_9TREM|nr:hypothetical protein EG68_07681 [Paragonimus skrjabini miyazakii]